MASTRHGDPHLDRQYSGKRSSWTSSDSESNTLYPQLCLFFAGGIFVGPAFDRYGSRTLMQLGTGCCLASFIGTSWSTQYWHFLLTQGALFGIGNALLCVSPRIPSSTGPDRVTVQLLPCDRGHL